MLKLKSLESLNYLNHDEITYDICRCLGNLRVAKSRIKYGRGTEKGGKFYTGLLLRGIVKPDLWNSLQLQMAPAHITTIIPTLVGTPVFTQESQTRNDYGLNTRARFMV